MTSFRFGERCEVQYVLRNVEGHRKVKACGSGMQGPGMPLRMQGISEYFA
jgi:hypothetical protein